MRSAEKMAGGKEGERGGGFTRSSAGGRDGKRRRTPGGETSNNVAETAATQEAQRGTTSHASGEAWQTQLDPPAPDSKSAPRGLGSAQSGAAPLQHPTQADHLSRYNLASVYRGSPGPVVLYSLRFFSVCQGPELYLKSSGLAACPRVAPSPRRCVAPSLSLSRPRSVPDPFWGLARVQE
ncbi:hypothetical protein NDU88_007554 [Pleurodeles waltl]|uniref:Uncharacterized protein n=1 Tax=Pleurodeles waltl TaxID=8319 RepID=A0AAV7VR53_PLEWA|nr:hypothetical protein NDU88_007554 [Pleurodeles waltl]